MKVKRAILFIYIAALAVGAGHAVTAARFLGAANAHRVALGAPVRSRAAGCVSFAAHAPGAAIFACGVALGNVMLHHAGIALVATGVLLLVAGRTGLSPRHQVCQTV